MKKTEATYYLVVGLGRSGLSTAKFLHSKGFGVKATDIDPARKILEPELNELGIETQVGFHDQETFDRASCLVVSPGIPLEIPHIKKARAKGVKITGELDIFARYNTTPVVAITGTNGKTTTTTLIRDMLESSGVSTFMGGNIGTPLLDYLMKNSPVQVVVAEISSFQLDLAHEFHPQVAVLLNLAPDHLDRYPDFSAYEESKWSIFKNQTPEDHAIINRDIPGFDARRPTIVAGLYPFSSDSLTGTRAGAAVEGNRVCLAMGQDAGERTVEIPCQDLEGLPGPHNRENLAAAALASLCRGATLKGILSSLTRFKGLPHRISLVREINQVKFYNDSKATNTGAVIRALETFAHDCPRKNIILILGGREKGEDFSVLIPAINKWVRLILAMGEAAPHIQKTFGPVCPVEEQGTMAHAVLASFRAGRPGDVVLLSPACASFDMYDNYEQRGDDFVRRVRGLGGGNG